MDSEAATENEWSESESESSVHDDVREARVHVAAQFSDTATMREELEAGENPNVRDYDGSTPLYLVCLFADKSRNEAATIECIRLLLAHGASPNTRNYGGAARGPLNYVASIRSSEAVAMLLEAGAKVALRGLAGQARTHSSFRSHAFVVMTDTQIECSRALAAASWSG